MHWKIRLAACRDYSGRIFEHVKDIIPMPSEKNVCCFDPSPIDLGENVETQSIA